MTEDQARTQTHLHERGVTRQIVREGKGSLSEGAMNEEGSQTFCSEDKKWNKDCFFSAINLEWQFPQKEQNSLSG